MFAGMSLFPNKDVIAQLQEQWRGYADALRQEDREAFLAMMDKCCYAYAVARSDDSDTATALVSSSR